MEWSDEMNEFVGTTNETIQYLGPVPKLVYLPRTRVWVNLDEIVRFAYPTTSTDRPELHMGDRTTVRLQTEDAEWLHQFLGERWASWTTPPRPYTYTESSSPTSGPDGAPSSER